MNIIIFYYSTIVRLAGRRNAPPFRPMPTRRPPGPRGTRTTPTWTAASAGNRSAATAAAVARGRRRRRRHHHRHSRRVRRGRVLRRGEATTALLVVVLVRYPSSSFGMASVEDDDDDDDGGEIWVGGVQDEKRQRREREVERGREGARASDGRVSVRGRCVPLERSYLGRDA